jgi:hypothetical protein
MAAFAGVTSNREDGLDDAREKAAASLRVSPRALANRPIARYRIHKPEDRMRTSGGVLAFSRSRVLAFSL